MSEFTVGFEKESTPEEEKVVSIEEKKKKLPFFIWNVAGEEYKLKITTKGKVKLCDKYKGNVLNRFMTDDIPDLTVGLTILQVALEKFHHGFTAEKVMNLYDRWMEDDDGDDTTFVSNVILPTLAVSGFFPREQSEELLAALTEE